MFRSRFLALSAVAGLCMLLAQPVVFAQEAEAPAEAQEVAAVTESGVIKNIDAENNQFTIEVQVSDVVSEVTITCNDETQYQVNGAEAASEDVLVVDAYVDVTCKDDVAVVVNKIEE